MGIALVSGAQLVDGNNTSTPSWSSITLPAGRLILAIGTRAGASRETTAISHPAITSATKRRDSGGVQTGSNWVRCSIWECQSNGGTGTLQLTHNGQAYQTLVQTLQVTELGDVVGGDEETAASASSLPITASASGVGAGIAACMTEPVNGAATLNATTWDDQSDLRSGASGYAQQRTVAEEGNVSGQTVTFSMSSGNVAAAGACLILLAAPAASAGAAALLPGSVVPGA